MLQSHGTAVARKFDSCKLRGCVAASHKLRRPTVNLTPLQSGRIALFYDSKRRGQISAGSTDSNSSTDEDTKVVSKSSSEPDANTNSNTNSDNNKRSPLHFITKHLASVPKLLKPFSGAPNKSSILVWLRLGTAGLLFCMYYIVQNYVATSFRTPSKEVLYSDFVKLLDQGSVKAARLESATSRIYFDAFPQQPAAVVGADAAGTSEPLPAQTGGVVTAGARSKVSKRFYVKLADKSDTHLIARILAAGVEFGIVKATVQSALINMFLTAFAVWIPLIPLFIIMRRLINERNSGTSRKKKATTSATTPAITFRDVAGIDAVKAELVEVVDCLKGSAKYSKLRAKMPGGVLLCGPPGTGKTLLARAIAGEAGVPFIAVSASEFVELFVGRGAARIRELFAEARKSAPCVVFIDELDAVGGRRGVGFNDERDQTLNQLLTELDGFEGRPGVLLLAATNRMDVLDPALLRPGRISRKVVVPLPDEAGRRDILAVHMRTTPIAGGLEEKKEACLRLARVTNGFSGAELANVVNEAVLLASRRDLNEVSMRELIEGVQRTKFGVNGGQTGPLSSPLRSLQNWLLDSAFPQPKAVKVGSS